MDFSPISRELLFTRNDPTDPRRGDQIKLINEVSGIPSGFVLAGYPDDEGVCNNGGRPGSSQGPDAIRHSLFRMRADASPLYDFGNLNMSGTLVDRHERVRKAAAMAISTGHRWLGFGGGHDYGYADGSAFLDSCGGDKRPLVINFDAHLDVRKPHESISSGTPFYRLAEHTLAYDFVQVGMQTQCNSAHDLIWSRNKGHVLITLDEYWESRLSLDEYLIQRTGDLLLRERPCYLSVDMDAFAWPYAIGSSQSWPTGFEPKEFWPCLKLLMKRMDVRMLGIYETAPPLDIGDGTAKLAALIADAFIREAGR